MSREAHRHFVAATALIRNAAGQILLVRTERRGWEPPGGQIEKAETLIEGLQREIYEESGVQVEVGRLGLVNTNLDSSVTIFGFQARYLSGDLRPSDETPQLRWASADEAKSMITNPAALQRVNDLLGAKSGLIYRAYRTNPFRLIETHRSY